MCASGEGKCELRMFNQLSDRIQVEQQLDSRRLHQEEAERRGAHPSERRELGESERVWWRRKTKV